MSVHNDKGSAATVAEDMICALCMNTGSHFLSAAEGQVSTCESVHIQIIPQPPNKLLLAVQPG